MSEEHANKLEVWFAGLPSLVQETLHKPFDSMNDGLKAVSGDPQELTAAAPQFLQFATLVTQLAGDQLQDRSALSGRWEGDAWESFSATVGDVDDQLTQLAAALRQVPDLLESGAQACTEGANLIIDIVTSLIMFALGIIATNVALALVTAGTSLAAGVVETLAAAARALAQVARVVAKVGQVLEKVASVLERLGQILRTVQKVLKLIMNELVEAKAQAKAAKGLDWATKKAIATGKNAAVSQGVKWGTGGLVSPPGVGGSALHAGQEYVDGWQYATDAVETGS